MTLAKLFWRIGKNHIGGIFLFKWQKNLLLDSASDWSRLDYGIDTVSLTRKDSDKHHWLNFIIIHFIWIANLLFNSLCNLSMYLNNQPYTCTVPTRHNLPEKGPQPNLGSPFHVLSGSAWGLLERNKSWPRADSESRPRFQKQTLKANPGSDLTNRPVNHNNW